MMNMMMIHAIGRCQPLGWSQVGHSLFILNSYRVAFNVHQFQTILSSYLSSFSITDVKSLSQSRFILKTFVNFKCSLCHEYAFGKI